MLQLKRVHHVAIICSDYKRSLLFYTGILGFTLLKETYRKERQSYKADLALNGVYSIELFSFPDPPLRVSRPEAAGLRHIAFEVEDIHAAIAFLQSRQVLTEPVRIDEMTGKAFTFFADPDGLPLELYQQ